MNRLLLLFPVLSFVLSACNGSASRVPGQQCPRKFNPVAMNIDPARKAQLSSSALPDGTYELTKTLLYFKGDPSPTNPEGFQVLIKEEVPPKSRDGQFQTVTDCFRNSKITESYAAKVQGITGLKIVEGHATTIVKTYGFQMNDDGTFEMQNADSDQKPSKPEDVFAKANETFVFTHGPGAYEIRSQSRGKNGAVFLSTFLRLKQ